MKKVIHQTRVDLEPCEAREYPVEIRITRQEARFQVSFGNNIPVSTIHVEEIFKFTDHENLRARK